MFKSHKYICTSVFCALLDELCIVQLHVTTRPDAYIIPRFNNICSACDALSSVSAWNHVFPISTAFKLSIHSFVPHSVFSSVLVLHQLLFLWLTHILVSNNSLCFSTSMLPPMLSVQHRCYILPQSWWECCDSLFFSFKVYSNDILTLLFTIYQLSLCPIFWSTLTAMHKPICSEVGLNCVGHFLNGTAKNISPLSLLFSLFFSGLGALFRFLLYFLPFLCSSHITCKFSKLGKKKQNNNN